MANEYTERVEQLRNSVLAPELRVPEAPGICCDDRVKFCRINTYYFVVRKYS